jgi:hypothetical protein
MRSDFVLPLTLAVALAAMVTYAASGDGFTNGELRTSPISCETSGLTLMSGLREASGLAASRAAKQLFWSHNDSSAPVLVAVGPDGQTRGRVVVEGASVIDWEAITPAPCATGNCLFIGDIGDNDRTRPYVTIYRAPEPAPSDASVTAAAVRAVYPEGPQDAEAMFVVGDTLYLVTKGEGTPMRVYRLPAFDANQQQTLQLVATLLEAPADKSNRITDATASPDGQWVALRSNDMILFYAAGALVSGEPATPMSFDLRALREPQGEGIAWPDGHTLFLSGEGERAGTIARISCNLPA